MKNFLLYTDFGYLLLIPFLLSYVLFFLFYLAVAKITRRMQSHKTRLGVYAVTATLFSLLAIFFALGGAGYISLLLTLPVGLVAIFTTRLLWRERPGHWLAKSNYFFLLLVIILLVLPEFGCDLFV